MYPASPRPVCLRCAAGSLTENGLGEPVYRGRLSEICSRASHQERAAMYPASPRPACLRCAARRLGQERARRARLQGRLSEVRSRASRQERRPCTRPRRGRSVRDLPLGVSPRTGSASPSTGRLSEMRRRASRKERAAMYPASPRPVCPRFGPGVSPGTAAMYPASPRPVCPRCAAGRRGKNGLGEPVYRGRSVRDAQPGITARTGSASPSTGGGLSEICGRASRQERAAVYPASPRPVCPRFAAGRLTKNGLGEPVYRGPPVRDLWPGVTAGTAAVYRASPRPVCPRFAAGRLT